VRYVWRTPPARRTFDSLNDAERIRYEQIEFFIAQWPYPMRGSTMVREFRLFGVSGCRYFDDMFPYVIFYEVDEHEILVRLIMKAATSSTPL